MVNERGTLLTPGEVALRFRVDPKTVTRWAAAGRLPCVNTPGGHKRFWSQDVDELVAASENLNLPELRQSPLEEYVRWVISLDDPDPTSPGAVARRTVKLTEMIHRARQALAESTL